MRFIIYGAGAVGSVLGGYMTLSGSDVVLIGRPQHVASINSKGLLLKDRDGDHTIHVKAVESLRGLSLGKHDLILLSTKSQDTAGIIAELSERAFAELPIFCFQNGVRNEEIAARFFTHVYGVLVNIGGRFLAPGEVVHYASRAVTMGCYPQGLDERLQAVSQALTAAGCAVTLSPQVMAVKWSKLIINLCNAFYALTGLSIPEAHRLKDSRSYMADIMQEGLRVLDAAGIDYEAVPGKGSLQGQIDRLRDSEPLQPWPEDPDYDYYPSTWQDLQLQRGTTETAFLNGEIIALGKRVAVPTPVNELLTSLVEKMAANKELPGKYTVTELRHMITGNSSS